MDKEELRKIMMEKRKQFTGKEEASEKIIQRVTNLPQWKQAKNVCVYSPFSSEVDTTALLKRKHVVKPEDAKNTAIDLYIIPGVAFDKQGNRLGRGGGFYDKLLFGKNSFKIGLAFEIQIVDTVPHEAHDIPMDFVVTERGVYGKTKTS